MSTCVVLSINVLYSMSEMSLSILFHDIEESEERNIQHYKCFEPVFIPQDHKPS